MFLGTTKTYSARSVDLRGLFCFSMMVGYPYLVPDLGLSNNYEKSVFQKYYFLNYFKKWQRDIKKLENHKKTSEINELERDLIRVKILLKNIEKHKS